MGTETRSAEIRARIQSIDPYEFEEFVAAMWDVEGWDTTVSTRSNDMGVDVIAEKSGTIDQKLVIQAKRYTDGNKVGRPEVQQYYSLKEQDTAADAAVVVTSSSFTSSAQQWAAEQNVKLVDGADLVDRIRANDLHDLVSEYVDDDQVELTEYVESETSSQTELQSETTDFSSTTDPLIAGAVTSVCLVALTLLVETIGLLYLFEVPFVPALPGSLEPVSLVGASALLAIVETVNALHPFDAGFVPVVTSVSTPGLFVIAWLVSPVAVFVDAHGLHRAGSSYRPNRLAWPLLSVLLPVLGLSSYLLVRLTGDN